MPTQPSAAIANGTATSTRSIVSAITQRRISLAVSQSRPGGATVRAGGGAERAGGLARGNTDAAFA
jgi:hypothetical protein